MLWNELEYDDQVRVINKINSLLRKESDPIVREGITAAMQELEMWSNSPCPDDTSVVEAQINYNQYVEADWIPTECPM